MKKLIAILLCTLLAIMPLQAMAAAGDIMVPRTDDGILTDGISDYCGIGDTFYMMPYDGNSIFTHKVGDTGPTECAITPELSYGDNYYTNRRLFSDGERLLTLVISEFYGEEEQKTTVQLCELTLNDGVYEENVLMDLDWEIFLADGYYYYIDGVIGVPGYAILSTYNDMGDPQLYALNLETGEIALSSVKNPNNIAYYSGGLVLVQQYDYEKPAEVALVTYDPATDNVETLATLEIEEYNFLNGIACNTETGEIYYLQSGEIYALDLEGGRESKPITDMALDVYTNSHPVILEGGYYACATYNGYAIRNLNPGEKSDTRLKIQDNCYLNAVSNVYYEFVNEHSDITAVLSRDYTGDTLIDSMMNRESDVDIYVMDCANAAFEAVFDRGYVADFRDSETLMAFGERIGENLREQLSVNGTFAALPMGVIYWTPRINLAPLEALGYKQEDVPTNWLEFVDFLLELQDVVEESDGYTLFDPWTSDKYARRSLFETIFDSYQDLLSYDANAADKQAMIEILNKLDQIDFSRFGQPTEEETMSEKYNPDWNEEKIILTTNVGTGLSQIAGTYYYGQPMVMSLTPDTPAFLTVDVQAAFINPYSEDIELATEFVEKLIDEMDDDTRYTFCQDLNDPVPDPYYDEMVKSAEENVERLEKLLADAEEADKQALEDELKWAKEYLEESKGNVWAISEQDIAFIRGNADQLLINGSNWLYADDSGEAYELIQQYAERRIDGTKLMNEIDRKIRMMLMEGY